MTANVKVLCDKNQNSQFLVLTPGNIAYVPGFPDGTTSTPAPSVFPLNSTLASIAAAYGVSLGAGVRLLGATIQTDTNYIFS